MHTGSSATLESIGVLQEFDSGRYGSLRPKYFKLDRQTQMPEIRKLMSLLVLNKEAPGRIHVVLVNEPLGY